MKHVFGVFLFGGLILSVGCGKNKPTEPERIDKAATVQFPIDRREQIAVAPYPKEKPEKPSVTPSEKPAERKPIPGAHMSETLVKTFLDNPEETKKKYHDKEIVVEGVILKTTEAAPATNLALKGVKDKDGKEIVLFCSFPYDERDKVEKLKVGDKVAVKGKFAYYVPEMNKLCVDMCHVVTE